MDNTEITHLSLCTGYGGIDLGLRRCIPNLRTVAYAEIEAFAVENLLARMEGGQLDAAPIWSDLKSFPWEQFSGLVDILSGGYPCQPFSSAGKRAGANDPRHLWPYIAEGIRLLRPRLCFFENVEGHITLGLSTVISDLEEMGYKVSWGIFSAAECGASHQRKRVFVMAHHSGEGLQGREWLRQARAQRASGGHTSKCGGAMAVASGIGSETGISGSLTGNEGKSGVADDCGAQDIWPSRPGEPQHAWEPPRVVAKLAESEGIGHSGLKTECGSVCKGSVSEMDKSDQECAGKPVRCSSIDEPPRVVGNAKSGARLGRASGNEGHIAQSNESLGNAADAGQPQRGSGAVERSKSEQEPQRSDCDYDNAECETQPALGRDADGAAGGMDYAELCVACDNRTDELRLLGNGVVPATCELAFKTLLKELHDSLPQT